MVALTIPTHSYGIRLFFFIAHSDIMNPVPAHVCVCVCKLVVILVRLLLVQCLKEAL